MRASWVVLLLVVSGFTGFGVYRALHRGPVSVELRQSTSGTPQIGGAFALQDSEGRLRTHREFKGKWMWVYFGYTFCPDICPTGLQTMGKTLKLLGPLGERLQPIFITVDPERDKPESLKLYQTLFHPRFVMLTGSKQAVQQAIRAYRVYAQPFKEKGATEYMIDHSAFIYLMDPEGNYVFHCSHDDSPDVLVERLTPYLARK